MEALEDTDWYIILTGLTTTIRGGIHINNISNFFKQCDMPLNAHTTCMQQIHLTNHEFLTLSILNKQEQPPVIIVWTNTNNKIPTIEPYNMLSKSTQIAQIKGYPNPQEPPTGIEPYICCNEPKVHVLVIPTLKIHIVGEQNFLPPKLNLQCPVSFAIIGTTFDKRQ